MTSVTQRIKDITQPRGGYVKLSEFDCVEMNDNAELFDEENIHHTLVGMAVDYLSRMKVGYSPEDAFEISLLGADRAKRFGYKKAKRIAKSLLKGIKGTDDKSIINACKLVSFDVWYRNPLGAKRSRRYTSINPDANTIRNIRLLVNRTARFLEEYGPIEASGFTFEPQEIKEWRQEYESQKGFFSKFIFKFKNKQPSPEYIYKKYRAYGGYTGVIDSGDGDFLTKDTLWDIKVSKRKPQSAHVLQLLIYYVMGKHSDQDIYEDITKIGIFNPRLNKIWILDMNKVSHDIIKIIEDEVICYE